MKLTVICEINFRFNFCLALVMFSFKPQKLSAIVFSFYRFLVFLYFALGSVLLNHLESNHGGCAKSTLLRLYYTLALAVKFKFKYKFSVIKSLKLQKKLLVNPDKATFSFTKSSYSS